VSGLEGDSVVVHKIGEDDRDHIAKTVISHAVGGGVVVVEFELCWLRNWGTSVSCAESVQVVKSDHRLVELDCFVVEWG